jgi:hypothetical protein
MKKILIMFLFNIVLLMANPIDIVGFNIDKKLVNLDFEIAFNGGKSQVLYITKYQIVLVKIKNTSNKVVDINPNYFTLVSDKQRSYSYSSETYAFKRNLKFLPFNELSNLKLYPNTETEGFLVFDKSYKDEKPNKLYFDNSQVLSEITVQPL